MDHGYYEEGDRCPKCNKGILKYPPVVGCTCHINAPCSACTDNLLVCPECGYQEERPESKWCPTEYPGLMELIHAPRPLDPTKIDYRVKSGGYYNMIKKGVYPEGTTRDQVEAVVRGSFGGKFVSFGNGRFEYIAYTD